MSSNLLKCGRTNLQHNDVRVIDTNTLMAKRLEALSAKVVRHEETADSEDGFVSGLTVGVIPTEGIPDSEEEFSSNVIKAQPQGPSAEEMEQQALALQEQANQILEQANVQAQQIIDDAMQQAQAEKKRIFDEAREQGYAEGIRNGENQVASEKQKLQQMQDGLEDEYRKMVQELEPQFIDVITDIYEHVFHVELKSYREVLLYLISATMRKTEGSRNFMIHISKEDYPYVSMQKKQIAAGVSATNSSVEIVEDITLSKNECLIETDNGIFDCGLGTQLNELKKRLMLLSYERS